jgi:hypothetical protein
MVESQLGNDVKNNFIVSSRKIISRLVGLEGDV